MTLTTQTLASLDAVPHASWDALVPVDNPFLQHAFLAALEHSASVGTAQTGWLPAHLLVWSDGVLVGAMPLYEKLDSYGEYIFDWAWAQAAYQAGIEYYPKLVSAIPFTPASGARLLYADSLDAAAHAAVTEALFAGLAAHAERTRASSIHLLFVDAAQADVAAAHGYARRLSHQFHWHRRSHWHAFDDFLADMRASARKQIKKERAKAAASGLRLSMRPISALSEADWQAMYVFYRHTVYEKGAQAYLTPTFFAELKRTMGEGVYVAMAHADETPVAGAQGDHKLKRGLLPALCHSAHWLRHPGLRQGVERFLLHEQAQIQAYMLELAGHTPFHRPHADSPPAADLAEG